MGGRGDGGVRSSALEIHVDRSHDFDAALPLRLRICGMQRPKGSLADGDYRGCEDHRAQTEGNEYSVGIRRGEQLCGGHTIFTVPLTIN